MIVGELRHGQIVILDRLRERGARLGLISDGHFETQIGKLQAWNLSDRFAREIVYIGSLPQDQGRTPGLYPEGIQLEGTKHQLATYHAITERVGRLYGAGAADCVMVGDDYTRHAWHPVQAGWRGVWFVGNEAAQRTRPPEAADDAVPCIRDLAELEEIVYPRGG